MDILNDKNLLWLAPLAGLTDISFRTICKNWGADILVSEMVSADGLKYSSAQTGSYAQFTEQQRPFAIQIFGSDPLVMAEGADIALGYKPDLIDINMGCPVKKVVGRYAGSALMKNTGLAADIVKKVKKVCECKRIPVSVKIRAGWDTKTINAVEFAKAMEEAGADMIIVHPRTRSQMFSGRSDWNLIKQVKQQVQVPVIGNGDVFSVKDALAISEQTGCDGIMIGRGAIGKPWIFRQIKTYLVNGMNWEPAPHEILATIKYHLELVIAQRGEAAGVKEMRTHLSAYTKGYNDAAKLRKFINSCEDREKIVEKITEIIGY